MKRLSSKPRKSPAPRWIKLAAQLAPRRNLISQFSRLGALRAAGLFFLLPQLTQDLDVPDVQGSVFQGVA